jgi:polyisoprenyl-phosphate glycosyltransferase
LTGRGKGDTLATMPAVVPTLTIVVPAFNEEGVLGAFHRRLAAALDQLGESAEILFVNDGSGDRTLAVLEGLRASDPRVGILDLSRNFGKEVALSAGLHHARGEAAVVVIDADLQDPPEVIPRLVAVWRERGADVVYAQRVARAGEGPAKRGTARLFYLLMQHVGRIHIPPDTGDFRLLSRRAVDALREYPEHHRFMKGLFTWIGFDQVAVPYERDPRLAGASKWSWLKLFNLAIEGITSFTATPLRFASVLGLLIASVAFLDALYIVYKTVRYGEDVAGYPSLMTAVLLLGGVQLTAIGILGEYLGRVFNETKRRPLYHVRDYHQPAGTVRAASAAERVGAG